MKRSLKTIVLCACVAWMGAADGARHTLDLRGAGDGTRVGKVRLMQAVQVEEGVLRRVSLEAGRTAVEGLEVGDELELALFDDVTLELALVEETPSPLGGKSFLARVGGYEGVVNAVVHQTGDGLQVDVQSYKTGKVYTIYSTVGGVKVSELVSGGVQCCEELKVPGGVANVPRVMDEVKVMTGGGGTSEMESASGETYVDILIVYDRLGAEWAELNGGATNFAEVSVQKMNTAIANTGLDKKFRFRLAGVKMVDGEGKKDAGASFNNILNAIVRDQEWNGYAWGNVQLMREAVGADIVCMLTDTGSYYGTTGSGFSYTQEGAEDFPQFAYCCCSIRAVAQGHTMTHEVGHNMGAGHSDKMANVANRGPQYYEYSSGYYFYVGDKGYYTIMAYNADGYGNTYYSVPYFSSPDYMYDGVAVGDATHDNTRTLANNFAAVAAFRASKQEGDERKGEPVIEPLPALTFDAATVYNGVLKSGTTCVGTIQVKAAKANSRTGISKLTVYVTLTGQKKKTIRGEFENGVAEFASGSGLELELTESGMSGMYGEAVISGAKDIFSSKDKADKEQAAKVLAALQGRGAVVVAWQKYFSLEGWNYLSVTVGTKGKVKAAGMLADGTKLSATTTLLADGSACAVPIVLAKQDMAFYVTMDAADREALSVEGPVVEPIVGYSRALTGEAIFNLERTAFSNVLGDATYADYFPNGVWITVNGTKWVLPKAGKITMKRGVLDESKAGENPSGLKLTYKAKDGTFTGSFKAYTANGSKIRSTSVKVAGVVIGGKGYGTAYIKKKGSAAVTIE